MSRFAGLAALAALAACTVPALATPVTLNIHRIESFGFAGAEPDGPLSFLGGLQISSDHPEFGGFSGVSLDVGTGYELQAITAAVLGGTQLLGGRGAVGAAIGGALTLTAIFTLLNFLGLPQPVREVVQGLILISAVALAVRRRGI